MTVETRRYTLKLYPNAGQAAALEQQCKHLASLWNAALAQREYQWPLECQRAGKNITRKGKKIVSWDDPRKGLSRFDQQKELKYIRKEDPLFSAMSSASLELTIKNLDLAFQAFWRRLKEGAKYKEAGYPKYKSVYRAGTKQGSIPHRDGSGWKLHQNGKNFKIYAKGIPGKITARGKFPVPYTDVRTMEIIKRHGSWWISIVTKQQSRMKPGGLSLVIDFDLLDKFAEISVKNGDCLASKPAFSESQTANYRAKSGGYTRPLEGTADMEGDDRDNPARAEVFGLEGTADMEGDDRLARSIFPIVELEGTMDFGLRMQFSHIRRYQDDIDQIKSERDRRYKKFSSRWAEQTRIIAKREARHAAYRKDVLHKWTSKIVNCAADITVITPRIKDNTKCAKGTKEDPGAAVEIVAALNKNTLSQAPAMTVDMLRYKAAEAGIEFTEITKEDTPLAVGKALPIAVKSVRRTKRKIKEIAA